MGRTRPLRGRILNVPFVDAVALTRAVAQWTSLSMRAIQRNC